MNKPTVSSLFSGIGGLDLGFQWAGFGVTSAIDNCAAAVDTYVKNLAEHAVCADLSALAPDKVPSADVIIGGPPCQSFSLVGQRKSDDPRGQLVFRYLDIVLAKKPLAFVMENVPGLAAARTGDGRVLDVLIDAFRGAGYGIQANQVIATDCGVPQLRKRLFIVGILGRAPSSIDFASFRRDRLGLRTKAVVSAKAAIGDLGETVLKGERSRYKSNRSSAYARILRAKGALDVSLHETPRMSATDSLFVSHIPPGGNYVDIPDEIATGRVLRFKQTGGRTTAYGRLHPDRPSYTINTYFRRPNVGANFHYAEDRLITPREAMRFQSLPDYFELVYGTQDERNTLIGNAVPPLMAEAVAWSLLRDLRTEFPNAVGELPQRSTPPA